MSDELTVDDVRWLKALQDYRPKEGMPPPSIPFEVELKFLELGYATRFATGGVLTISELGILKLLRHRS